MTLFDGPAFFFDGVVAMYSNNFDLESIFSSRLIK